MSYFLFLTDIFSMLLIMDIKGCRRRPQMDTPPELMWTVRREVCGHRVGVHVDTLMV